MIENQSKGSFISQSTDYSHAESTPTNNHTQPISKSTKYSPIPKPDFSSIEKKESSFTYKQKGSYKKQKSVVPESPMKSPNQRIFTPIKFDIENSQPASISDQSTCRKLTFAERIDEEEISNKGEGFIQSFKQNNGLTTEQFGRNPENFMNFSEGVFSKYNNNHDTNCGKNKNNLSTSIFNEEEREKSFSPERINSVNKINLNFLNRIEIDTRHVIKRQVTFENKLVNNYTENSDYTATFNDNYENKDTYSFTDIDEDKHQSSKNCESKFEKEFFIIKTLEAGSFGIVYKCLNKLDNKIYAVKKSKKHSSVSDYYSIQNLITDFNLNKSDKFSNFCVNSKECWLEGEVHEHTLSDDHLYITQDFCLFGDILNYLEKLERVNTPENRMLNETFYWDLIFEMMCGIHFVHKCGYVHLDVKPGNFLVNENGAVKIGDFGLTKKLKDIRYGEDFNEGDSSFVAPEFFGGLKKLRSINIKCDVFSLGLSILEIICKVEIPEHGILWNQIRSKDFSIPTEFLLNSNIKIKDKMIKLIMEMLTIDADARPNLVEIFENEFYDEIYTRYNALLLGKYSRSFNPSNILKKEKLCDIDILKNNEISKLLHVKRSNSYRMQEDLI